MPPKFYFSISLILFALGINLSFKEYHPHDIGIIVGTLTGIGLANLWSATVNPTKK